MKRRTIILSFNRRKLFISYLLFSFMLGIFLGIHRPGVIETLFPNLQSISGKVIVIDAGHGGRDPGAEGRSGLEEKNVTIEIAKELHDRLSQVGVKVILTRKGDEDLADQADPKYRTYKERDLWRRVDIANQSKADLFLSIHVNSFPQSIWSGAQTFYQEGGEEGARLARAIQSQLVERLGPNRRKARPADYRVLRSTNMPAAIVEVGFISNPREEGLLTEPEYQKKLAEAIFLGVIDYFNEPVPKESSPTLGPNHHSHVFPYVPEYPLKAGQVRLYFADPNNEDIQLREEVRDLTGYRENWDLQHLAEATLYELSRGPGEHSALLPAAPIGSWLKQVEVKNGVAYLSLTPEYEEKVDGGGASEILSLYAIVNTLTGLPGIDGVVLRSESQKDLLIGGHILFDQEFKRDNGYIADNRSNSQKLNN
ncbi:MAG TPA: N-acetylmuramoyl-L-alanine amidase CwlD [Bacillota bacterium]|nr:N-acetylmuramoyl-L-alanine amidase CwlD [Bacillota bacterium]